MKKRMFHLAKFIVKSPDYSLIDNTAISVSATSNWGSRLMAYALSLLLLSQPLAVTAQVIVADVTHTQQTKAQNGVPVINIATPSSNGVSHNQFQQFNVEQHGLILNNAQSIVSTQLGGFIVGNPNLQHHQATLIINEVMGANRSQLNGYTEVAGQAAAVIVANPYGITCNGCGFINTPRATLTTGRPVLQNGLLSHLAVSGGDISIEGQGINASNLSRFDIITRATTVNADIHAQKLNIVLGANNVHYADLTTATIAATGGAIDFALDTSALGGMYANAIRLIGTEAGVGVRTLANVASRAGDLTLSADGAISVAKLQSAGDLTLTSAANDIHLNDTIHSDSSLALNASGTISNNSTITADNNLTITATNLHQHGTLAAGNDVQANIANNLTNTNTLYASNDIQLYVGNTLTNKPNAIIIARNNLTIAANSALDKNQKIHNNSATIESLKGDIHLATHSLENTTTLPTIITTNKGVSSSYIYRPQRGGAIFKGSVALPRTQGYNTLKASHPAQLDIFEHYGSKAAWNSFWTQDSGNRVRWFDVHATIKTQSADLSTIKPANLLAGNNLTINAGSIKNQLSLIAAEGDIAITGTSLSNKALALTKTATGGWRLGRMKKDELGHLKHDYVERAGGINGSDVIANVNSSIQAGGDFTGSFTDRIDNDSIKQHISGSTGGSTRTPGSGSTADPNILLTLPNNNGLFVISPDSTHPYLVETNPAFTKLDNFISSDYMLSKLGLKPEDTIQRLGDGFYESRLLREAIFAQTGRRYLQGQHNDQAQFQYLMDNGISVRKTLELSVGIALNAEQVARLTHDIVWMVEKEVQGHAVLVPHYYAATLQQHDLYASGALISATHLELTGQGINNSGTLEAAKKVQLTSTSNIVNSGIIRSGDDISLIANTALRNIGGDLLAKGDMMLVAHEGDIELRRFTKKISKTMSQDGRSYHYTDTYVGKASVIQSGGNISLQAGQDINISGSNINAQDNITAQAGRNMSINTTEVYDESHGQTVQNSSNIPSLPGQKQVSTSSKTSHFNASSLEHIASQLRAGGDISLIAQNDLAIVGSTVAAQGNTNLSGNNVTITAAAEQRHYDYDSKGNKRSSKRIDNSTLYKQARISGNNVTINSANNLTVAGSELTAKNDIKLQSNGSTTLASVENSEYHYYYTKNKQSFGRKTTQTSEQETVTNIGSLLTAGNDVLINVTKAEGDDLSLNKQATNVHVAGSDIKAANDIAIYAGNNITASPSTDYNYSFYEKTKKGFGGLTGSSKKTTTKQKRQQRANFSAQDDISFTAGNNIALIAPNVTASDNIDINAKNKVYIGVAKDSDYEHVEYSKTGAFKWEFGNKGRYDETIRHTEITAGGDIRIDAGNGVIVDYKQNGTLTESIDTLSQLPELAWMGELKDRDDIDWQAIEEAHEQWQEHEEGVGGPGVTLVMIAVAIATGGAGAGMLGLGEAAAAGTLTAIEVAQIAIVDSLINQAATSLITNGGDIGAVFSDLLSKDGLLSLATAGMTAGITNGLFDSLGISNEAINLNSSTIDTVKGLSLGQQLQRNIISAAVQSGVSTTLQGGDFADNLFTAAASATVNTLAIELGCCRT